MIRVAILLFLCVIGNSNEDDDWLKCKLKPGCSMARCDPQLGNSSKLDEYAILCQKNEPYDDPSMKTNYADVLEELAKLKGRLERSEREGSEMNVDINVLERETTRMKSLMEKARNESESKLNNALQKINILERKTTRMKSQMEKERNESESKLNNALNKVNILEREDIRIKRQLEEMENRMEKEGNESESALNNALKKINILEREGIRIKSQLEEMGSRTEKERNKSDSMLNNALKKINILEHENSRMKSQMEKERNESEGTLNNWLKNLEEKIENKLTSWRMKAENVSCAITFNGICYWTYVQEEWNVTFARAEEICSNKASKTALFPTEEVYNSVAEDIRSKTSTRYGWSDVWTGITVDTNTGNVTHPSGDNYVKWYPGYPRIGSYWENFTYVALNIKLVPGSTYQGIYNNPRQWSRDGVVCQSVE